MTGGREYPAIVADGKYVHMVWNDNRDAVPGKGMSVYYRRSSDMGATWGPQTPLTHAPDYTYCPTISLAGSHVDVAFADRQSGTYHICHLHSADFGTTWDAKEQITTSGGGEFYPAIVRDSSNLHMVWTGKEGIMYLHSSTGGGHWDPAVNLSQKGAMPFIAVAGDAVHVIFMSHAMATTPSITSAILTGNRSEGSNLLLLPAAEQRVKNGAHEGNE